MKLTYNISIKNGSLKVHNREKMNQDISKLKDMSGSITIEKKKVKRSDPQNKFYWAGVVVSARAGFIDAGYSVTKEQVHIYFRDRFLEGKEIVSTTTGEILEDKEGRPARETPTTTSLTKSEFSDYIEEIRAFCISYLNIDIPAPNEQTEIQY